MTDASRRGVHALHWTVLTSLALTIAMNSPDLEADILTIVRLQGPIRARDIARQLGVSRKDVNSILYGPLRLVTSKNAQNEWSAGAKEASSTASSASATVSSVRFRTSSRTASTESPDA